MDQRPLATLLTWIFIIQVHLESCEADTLRTCRDRNGLYGRRDFILHTCSMCYFYLELKHAIPKPHLAPGMMLMRNGSTTLFADPDNSTVVDTLCSDLDKYDCTRWKECCAAAKACCQDQLDWQDQQTEGPRCPMTWDGFSCWAETDTATTARVSCPSYMAKALPSRHGVKTCTENATWFRKDVNEWTDYTPCIDKQRYMIGVYLCVICSSLSIALLVPAIIIFLHFRELIRQHRVRLHVHFFLSLALSGMVVILWNLLVHRDTIVVLAKDQTVLYTNPVWCRILSFLKIYLTGTTYFWMFCEGNYLHRLISNAFKPPKSLVIFYIIGWGGPLLPAVIYAIIRGVVSNTRCWVLSHGTYEWIFDVPNLLCLLLNLFFLCNILRILLFQLHSHPHEPNNFRRGLKAAFMLVPLFGLQLFLTIYRPPDGSPAAKEYEYVGFFVTNSQGIFVSLIFCFFNGEVLTQMRARPCCCYRGRDTRDRYMSTQMTQVSTVGDDQ